MSTISVVESGVRTKLADRLIPPEKLVAEHAAVEGETDGVVGHRDGHRVDMAE